MYVWIWRHLPGGLPGKLLGSLVLLAAAVLVLFVYVFPVVEERLPYSDVTVDAPQDAGGPQDEDEPTPTPTPTPGEPSPLAPSPSPA